VSLFTSGGLGLKNLVLFTPQLAVGVEPVTAVSSPAVVHCLLSHTQPPLLLSTSPRRLFSPLSVCQSAGWLGKLLMNF